MLSNVMLMYLVLVASFLISAHVISCAVIPTNVAIEEEYIVGGSPAQIIEAPYSVALLLDSTGGGYFIQACSGSILSRTVILTAAHCTDGTIASRWKIRAGSSYHNSGGQVIPVTRYVQHSSFNSRLDNDISLLFLANALNLSSSVVIATLPTQGQIVPDGVLSFITGWGTLSEGGSQPTQLYKVTIPIVNQQQCINAYAGFNPVTSNMICAGKLGVGGQDACQGDSGGAMVINSVLIGITSWGRGCGQANSPGVWTRVPVYRNWINNNM